MQSSLQNPNLSVTAFQQEIERKYQCPASERVQVLAELTGVLDLFLQNKWTDADHPGKRQALLAGLNQLLGPQAQGNIVLAQIDSRPGHVVENAQKVMAYMMAAEAIGADMVIFPELSLMGYPIYDAIGRYRVLVEQNIQMLQALAQRSGKTRAVVGFVEPRQFTQAGRVVGKSFYNSVAILGEGQIEGVVRKSLLPTYGEFDDYRMFEPSPASGTHPGKTLSSADWGFTEKAMSGIPSNIHGHYWGISICEDGWNDDSFFHQGKLYRQDPVEELIQGGAEVIINTSASPTRALKEQLKHSMLASVAQRYQRPIVYVNRSGAVDESVFDGVSRVYDAQGHLVARAKAFEEQFLIANPFTGLGSIEALPKGEEQTFGVPKTYNPHDSSDLERTYKAVVQGIQSYFQSAGAYRAVLGLSGGLDSSAVATLLAESLGPENVLGISMPSKITSHSSKTDAHQLAENLGIHFIEIPIQEVIQTFESQYTKLNLGFWGSSVETDIPHQNLQAITRATYLRYLANQFSGCLPIATSDKSELYVGYSTVNGDMSGALAPIGDITKMKLFALARFLNNKQQQQGQKGIPEAVLHKKPGAELSINPQTGLPVLAEEDYGPYEFRDEIIWRMENLGQTYDEMKDELFWYEKQMLEEKTPVSVSLKQEWLEKFFHRMGVSFFKWYIMPTTLNLDTRSITKSSFRIPISVSNSYWRQLNPQEISEALNCFIPLETREAAFFTSD